MLGDYFQRRFWSARSPEVRWRRRQMPAVRCLQSPRAFPPRLMRQSPGLDYSNLRLRTWVNGDLRRDSSTRELSISPNKLLSYVSQNITLLPGDVIFTGTPGKTQAVTHGDTIEIEIEGVGRLRNSVAVR